MPRANTFMEDALSAPISESFEVREPTVRVRAVISQASWQGQRRLGLSPLFLPSI